MTTTASNPKKKRKAKHLLEDVSVREVSLVSRPAIGRTYLLMKADDGIGIDMTTDKISSEFSSEDIEQYLTENLADYTGVAKAATKREQGFDFPSAAYAYVPDSTKPSTWKLRLWETPQKKVTRRQVGMAIAALGKGFRGRKVQIPAGDLAKVKAKVRAAWNSVHGSGDTMPAALKSDDAGTTPAIGANTMNEKLVELLKSAELADEVREAITGALDTILKSEVSEDIMKSFYELAGYEIPKEEVEVVKEVEKIVEVEKEAKKDEKTELLKGLDDKALALFKEQETRIERAEKAAQAAVDAAEVEKQTRIEREFVQKAANEFPGLPFTAEEFGPVLKAVEQKLDEKESKAVLKIFNTAKDAIAATKQDEEFGNASDGGKTLGSEPEYVKRAKAMVEKGDASTEAQAIAKLYDTEPKLFLED